jgi:hypothetical protein
MRTVDVRLELSEEDLLDAGEDLERLLERERDVTPSLRSLLYALDDAITRAFTVPPRAGGVT